ncbi:MAG: undecaprenyl-diphosphate phosphatase [Candidatus Heimdallarchaeota archaeon]
MKISLWEALILAVLQGTLEWLPVSSEGQVVLVSTQILKIDFSAALALALLFHGGTAAVILIRFRSDFAQMVLHRDYDLISPTMIATATTALTALPLLFLIEDQWVSLSEKLGSETASGEIVTLVIGVSLVITGAVLRSQTDILEGERFFPSLSNTEAMILGFVQGLAVLPGISRSAMTVSFLLYIGLKQQEALRGSFVVGFFATMGASVLEILLGNIKLEKGEILVASGSNSGATVDIAVLFLAFVITFIAGWISMDILLKMSREFAFWKFCIVFGLVAILLTIGPFLIDFLG